MGKLRYICYSRKSSEAKERQALSIPDQIAECKKYAEREDLNIICWLKESKSAFKPNIRFQFDEMIGSIKSGTADAILTWKPDRLCRNPEEGGKILQLLQDGVLKEIRTAAGDVYTPESDHLVLQIHFGMANQYSRNLSRDVRRGLKYKASRGEYVRAAPVGYEGHGETRRRLMRPHPFEAPLVEKAFRLAATGKYSLRYITDYLYTEGLRTKRGKPISKSHLYGLLTSPIYYGCFYYNGELYQGSYEPIINKQLFDVVQEALKDRSKPKANTWEHLYNGLAKCGICNCAITTTVKVKNYKRTKRTALYSYHHCTHRRGNCGQPAVTTKEFEVELSRNIEKISIDEEVWRLGIKLLKAKHKHETDGNMKRLNALQKKYNGLQDKLNRLIAMRADEELTKDEFLSQKESILKEQFDVKALLEDNEDSSHNWLELAENFLNTAFYARDVMENGTLEEKRNLIMDVGENLFLKDKKLQFSFREPYNILLLPKYRTNVQGWQDSNLQDCFWRAAV